MEKISITDFADIQKLQERFCIPFTVSMTMFVTLIFNHFELENEDKVELEFLDETLSSVESYTRNPASWANKLQEKCKYKYIVGLRRTNKTILIASNTIIEEKGFFKNLVATLQTEQSVEYKFDDLSISCRQNPFMLLRRLRPQFPSIKIDKDTLLDTITFSHEEPIETTSIN